ncbi:MAG: exodeoxyribonuclease VII small subunit [Firmicutes bacterium]|nr:exodeoxyribonuclease VII small subunit [Bacillota bacterium]
MSSKNFEKDYEKLKAIVKEMEKEDVSLDQSLKNFEQATKLYKDCRDYLVSTKKKIKILNDGIEDIFEKDSLED